MNKKETLLAIAKEIRDIVDKKQKDMELSFVEDTHTYYIKDTDGVIRSDFPSVSTVICQFYNEFPSLNKSYDMANRDLVAQDTLLQKWSASADYATNKGSRVHYILEKDVLGMYGSYKTVRKPIFECDGLQITEGDLMIESGRDFIQTMHDRGAILLDTEMVLGSAELGYTGQPDKVWVMFDKNDDIGFIITDWKGLPLDTQILTDSGWKTMGTLTKIDKVFDKDGNLVNIKNISEVKNKKCLKIKFDNNEEIVSDFEHRWLVFTERNGVKKEKVLTTQEIKDYNDNLGKRYSYKILKVDNPKPLNVAESDLPIDPYDLGFWVARGHSVNGVDIHSILKKLNLLSVKRLSDIYLLSSFEQRLALLRGLMDSNGYYDKTNKCFSIDTSKISQAEFCISIISSLGIKTTVTNYKRNNNGEIIESYVIEFTTNSFNPFLRGNDGVGLVAHKKVDGYRTIVSVEEVESVPTKCIEVDSASNTFLCGKSLIVTHNTNKPKNFEVHSYTEKMLSPFEEYDDTALTHYKIQLPLYGRLILDMLKGTKYEGIKFFGCIIVLLKGDGSKYSEYRVENSIIKTVLTMNPLPRINEVRQYKALQKNRDNKRKELLNIELKKRGLL